MPWFKVDDTLAWHPKAAQAGNAALGLWVRAGSWSMQQLTDGYVPAGIAAALGTAREAKALVNAGLWHKEPGGYRFHQWLDVQRSREQVLAERAAAAERQRAARERNAKAKNERDSQTDSQEKSRRDVDRTSDDVTGPQTRPDQTSSSFGTTSAAAAADARDRAAAAAAPPDDHPPTVQILRAKLDQARLTVRWDTLTDAQVAHVDELVHLHGDDRLVKAAQHSRTGHTAAPVYATAWLPVWDSLPPPGKTLAPVAGRCDTHHQTLPCTGCAADAKAAR